MEKINNQMKGVRFRGLTWDEREIIVSGLLEKGFNASMIAGILNTSRQNISNVVKRMKQKNFDQENTKFA
jgi:transcriptional regulator